MKGWRTLTFNVVMTVVMIVNLYRPGEVDVTAESVNATLDAIDTALTAAWGLGNVLLRAVTNTPLGKKGD